MTGSPALNVRLLASTTYSCAMSANRPRTESSTSESKNWTRTWRCCYTIITQFPKVVTRDVLMSIRTCEWCDGPIPEGADKRSKTCSPECQKARRKDYNRKYHTVNRDKLLSYQKWYRETHPEKKRESNRKTRLKAGDDFRIRARMYYARNKEKIRERERSYYNENKQEIRVRENERWRSKPPEQRRTGVRRHLEDMLQAQDGQCVACLCPIDNGNAHVDHIIPKARGGTDERINLQALCGPCNMSKGAKKMDEWPGRISCYNDNHHNGEGRPHVD